MHRKLRRPPMTGGWFLWTVLLLMLVHLAGCESATKDDAGDGSESADDLAAAVADDRPVDPLDYPVPEGDAAALMQFMSEIVSQGPRGNTDEERTQDVGRQMDARIRAAKRLEKIAENDDQLLVAQRTKLESMRVLAMIGREHGREAFSDYAQTLAESSSEQAAKIGRIGKYQSKLDSFLTQESDDASSLITALEQLIENEGTDRPVFDAANETAMVLRQIGIPEAAGSVFELIGNKFADSDDAEIAEAAQNAIAQSRMARVGTAFQQLMAGEEGGQAALLKAAEAALAADQLPSFVLMPMVNVVQNLEYSGNVQAAGKLYELMKEAAAKAADERVKEQVETVVQSGQLRLALIGGPFEIVGKKVDGEEFSWSDYEGKVVLVDFWATWCGPCLAEVPNMRENFEQYHDLGFDVVGVNLDEEGDRVTNFFEQNELPWVTVISDDEQALGFNNPNATRYGVDAIPFLVLVGRDGNVDSLHLRGELLNNRLAELFPDAAEATGVQDGDAATDLEAAAEASGDVEMDLDETGSEEDPDKASEDETDVGQPEAVELEETETLPPSEPPQQTVQLETNPYLADDELSANELMLYLLELTDKPKSIQARPGFRDAVVDAADRILADSQNDKHRKICAQTKLDYLHRDARLENHEAQTQLMAFVEQLRREMPDAMAEEIRFFQLEQQALQAEAAEQSLLDSCCTFLEEQGAALDQRHLRLASSTVELVNSLPADQREPYFARLATALAASETRDVARYGKRLASKPKDTQQLIGQELKLAGVTVDGNTFDIEHYRHEIVVVDFWAAWCGPCRKAHPILAALAGKYDALRIVGVNLDTDEEALAEYLQATEVPGITLWGKEPQQAAEDYGIRALPTFLVLDGDGKIQAVTNDVHQLDGYIAKLIQPKLAETR